MKPLFHCVNFFIAATLLTVFVDVSLAEDFQLQFVDGNAITVEILDRKLDWKTIEKSGSVREATVLWSAIDRLDLTNSPASSKAEELGQCLIDLGSPEYMSRHEAELKLSDPEFASGFRQMIQAFGENSVEVEVQIRISRIIARLAKSDTKSAVRFDELTVGNRKLQGDSGNFRIRVNFRGKELFVNRGQLMMIQRDDGNKKGKATPRMFSAELFYKPGNEFYQPQQRTIDFSVDSLRNEIQKRENIENAFIGYGVKFDAESPKAEVVVSSYDFNAFGKLPRNRSIAVYEGTKRFKGVMEVSFCMPGQPSIPAGVREFGTFIASVEEGRDFILEGFNASGHLIVHVECPSDRCGFMGFRTTEPVAYLRVLSNPYLSRVDRSIDEDYGLDHFCLSKPEPVRFSDRFEEALRLKNGNVIRGEISGFDGQQLKLRSEMLGSLEFGLNELQEVVFAANPEKPADSDNAKGRWLVTLEDGSQLACEAGDAFSIPVLGVDLTREQIVALSHSSRKLRFPLAGDYKEDRPILVFPTCRIVATGLGFNENGFTWNKDAQKLLQPVDKKNPLGKPGVDPTPGFHQIDYQVDATMDLPSLWLRAPRVISGDLGVVVTREQESIAFGEGALFQLKSISAETIVMEGLGGTIELPMEQIRSIRWPTKS
ncbi:MAG: hypothetical protein AAFN77_07590 [Planctomycetota bacterium]